MKPKYILYLLATAGIISLITVHHPKITIPGEIQKASLLNLAHPEYFEIVANHGQFNGNILFTAQSAGHTVLFHKNSITFERGSGNAAASGEASYLRFTLNFQNANHDLSVEGIDKTRNHNNFFLGNDSKKWEKGVPGFKGIRYQNLYNGIDLVYNGDRNTLKSTFYIEAGQSPDQIRMNYKGDVSLNITGNGSLEISTPAGKIVDSPPIVYQVDGNKKIFLKAGYRLFGHAGYGFRIQGINPGLPLVIDPELGYAGTFGGSKSDQVTDIAVDKDGMLYFTGRTFSADFPTVNAAYPDQPGGPSYLPQDVYIVKLNPTTGEILFATYLGGTQADETAYGIAVDDLGNVYVTGTTNSDDFPLVNAYQDSRNGYGDAFVVKLNSSGQVVASTYFGGSGGDIAYAIAVDGSSNIWIVGQSADIPTASPLQSYGGGSSDAFIAQFNSTGNTLLFGSPFGGNGYDEFLGMVAGANGYLYITGDTYSSDFPLQNATQGTLKGVTDAVVVVLKASDKSIFFSSYYGGSDFETGKDIAVDLHRNFFMLGSTGSTDLFLANETQSTPGGDNDMCVAGWHYDPNLMVYVNDFSTYLGGNAAEFPRKISVTDDQGPAGNVSIAVAGQSSSTDYPKSDTFPEPYAPPPTGVITQFSGLQAPGLKSVNSGVTVDYSSAVAAVYGIDALAGGNGRVFLAGATKDTNNVYYGSVETFSKMLKITKSADADSVAVGDTIRFRIKVENLSESLIHNVVVEDVFDTACFAFSGVYGQFTADTLGTGEVLITVPLGDLAGADSVTVTVIAKGDGDCLNTADAYGEDAAEVSDQAYVFIGRPVLDIEKTTDAVLPAPGDTIIYQITISNTGNYVALNTYIFDFRKFCNSYLLEVRDASTSAKVPFDPDIAGGGLGETVNINRLEPGETRTFNFKFRLRSFYHNWSIRGHAEFLEHTVRNTAVAFDSRFDTKDQSTVTTEGKDLQTKQAILRLSGYKAGQKSAKGTPASLISNNIPDNTYLFLDSVLLGTLPAPDTGIFLNDVPLSDISPYLHLSTDPDTFLTNTLYAQQFDFYQGDITDETFNLPRNYQLLIPDYVDDPMVILKKDWRETALDENSVDLYVANAIDNGIAYDLRLSGEDSDFATGLGYGTVSDYISLTPGTYTIEMRKDGAVTASFDVDLQSYAGASFTLVLVPYVDTDPHGTAAKLYGESGGKLVLVSETGIQTQVEPSAKAGIPELSYRNTDPLLIDFTLPGATLVTMDIYDINGRKIASLANSWYQAGQHTLPVRNENLSQGLYICRMKAGENQIVRKIIIY